MNSKTANGRGLGIGGLCICPKCGKKIPHKSGNPCQKEKCPICGAKMVRKGSNHHKLIQEKRTKENE
jgi:predicted amidophosphoribosyltransferase